MTRRERLEAKLDKRRAWASKAEARSAQRFDAAGRIADLIPLGQPILINHHSERHARRDADRIHTNMSRGVEEHRLAEHHTAKAGGLADQLDRSVFSDDADAIEQLEARIAQHKAKADKYAAINKAWRKSKGDLAALVASGLVGQALAETITTTMKLCPWLKVPLDTTNLRARIRGDYDRIAEIRRRQERSTKADAAGGILIEGGEWVRVTFAEKPERSVLDALKAAGFSWGGGSWGGPRAKLPTGLIPGEEQ
jgi:hypothetical protein